MKTGSKAHTVVVRVATVAACAAILEVSKIALSFIPNVELVTFFCAFFGCTFGFFGVISAFVFAAIEPFIYGFGTWVISYFIYWPLVSAVFCVLFRKGACKRWALTLSAVVLTVFFGVLTSFVDITVMTGIGDGFFRRFIAFYLRGTVFYAIQTLSNAVIFFALFPVALKRLKPTFERLF